MVMKNRKAWGSYFGTIHNFWHWKQEQVCKELDKTSCWKRGSSLLLGNSSLLALTWTFSRKLSWSPILQAVPKLLFSLPGGISEEPRARIHRTSPLSKKFQLNATMYKYSASPSGTFQRNGEHHFTWHLRGKDVWLLVDYTFPWLLFLHVVSLHLSRHPWWKGPILSIYTKSEISNIRPPNIPHCQKLTKKLAVRNKMTSLWHVCTQSNSQQ